MFQYENNKNTFVQTNLPGLSAYGQKGSQGDRGETGGSIYFTPYDMKDSSIFKEVKYMIDSEGHEYWSLTDGDISHAAIHGVSAQEDRTAICRSTTDGVNDKMFAIDENELCKELSNNKNYDNDGIFYNWLNDSIVDVNGDVYELIKWVYNPASSNFIGRFQKTHNLFNSSQDASVIVDASVVTEFNDNTSPASYKQKNLYYIGYTPVQGAYNRAPQTYYRGYYDEYTYGNFLKITVTHKENTQINYNFKYVVCLPNGERIEKYSKSDIEYIFIDNKFLYGCSDTALNTGHISGMSEDSPLFTQNYAKLLRTYRTELPQKQTYSPTHVYVEVINMNTGKTYIVYANSIN